MLVSLANQRLIRFRQRKRRKIGAYRRHLKSRPRSQPSSQRHHAIAMRLVLLGLAEVRISPADEHVLALDSRHDAYVILAAAPFIPSAIVACCFLRCIPKSRSLVQPKVRVYTGRTADHRRLLPRSLITGHIEVRFGSKGACSAWLCAVFDAGCRAPQQYCRD